MNNWSNEFMAEYHRQQILTDARHIRLKKTAINAHIHQPRLFEQTMFRLANWMIATGKQLRERYEVPAVQCRNSATGSFAH